MTFASLLGKKKKKNTREQKMEIANIVLIENCSQ